MSGRQNMWSVRRAAVKAEAEADARAAEVAVLAQEKAALEEKSDAEILAELDLKDPDDLVKGDDFSAFMQKAVPERIRRRALRKLWLSNPVLANVDNLVDYGDDFAAEGKLGLAIKTSYQVGKGLLAHVEEMEKQALAKDDIDEPEQEPEEIIIEKMAEVQVAADAPQNEDPVSIEETQDMPVKRHMRFRFAS